MADSLQTRWLARIAGRVFNTALLIVVLVAAAVIINDVGRYMTARYNLDQIAEESGRKAANAAKQTTGNTQAAFAAANAYASQNGVEIYGFALEPTGQPEKVHVWARTRVKGLWALDRYENYKKKLPKGTGYMVTKELTTLIY